MNLRFLCLAGAAALLCLAAQAKAAEAPRGRVASSGDAHADVAEQETAGATYYLDCQSPVINGDGRSLAKPWHALDAVNEHTFLPGDTIRLKR